MIPKNKSIFVTILMLVAALGLLASLAADIPPHLAHADELKSDPGFIALRVFAHKEPEEIGYSIRVVSDYGEAISLDEMRARGWQPVTFMPGDDGYNVMVFESVPVNAQQHK